MTAPVRLAAPQIAVAGATGEVGGRVAQLLAAQGVAQRLPVRAARRSPRPHLADVVEVGGYEDRRGMRAALEGIQTFLLIPGADPAGRVEGSRAAIQAAVGAGVERIVQLSFVGAAADATSDVAREQWLIEQDLQASGLEWTIARANVFIDVLPTLVSRAGEIRGPAGDGRIAAISRDDVALALAALVTGDGHARRIYDLAGPESLNLIEIAGTLGRSCRQRIRYRRQTLEEAIEARAAEPAGEVERPDWIPTYAAVAAGELAELSPDAELLTGEPLMTLAEWLRAYPFSLMHVGALL